MFRDSEDARRAMDDEPVEQCDANGEALKEFEELVAELLIAEANFRLASLGERPKYLSVRETVRMLVLKRYAEAIYGQRTCACGQPLIDVRDFAIGTCKVCRVTEGM